MLSITQCVCEVATTENPSEVERGVVWFGYTQKELINQHSTIQYHHSEKLFSMYKSIMVC